MARTWVGLLLWVCLWAFAGQGLAAQGAIPVVGAFEPGQLRGWQQEAGYQYARLGTYDQDYPGQPILWRVLGVVDGRALLLSEFILDVRPFDGDSNEWADSDLRSWLNGSFYRTAFSEGERAAILPGGRDLGAVFLLSRAELSDPAYGFSEDISGADPARSARGTAYAYDQNLWRVKDSEYTNYYARSRANNTNVHLITSSGEIRLGRIERDNVGIRPALWVDAARLPFTQGSGSYEDPFR